MACSAENPYQPYAAKRTAGGKGSTSASETVACRPPIGICDFFSQDYFPSRWYGIEYGYPIKCGTVALTLLIYT